MVAQFTEMDRCGLNWLRVTETRGFWWGHGKCGTHKWKCQVGKRESGVLRKIRSSHRVCVDCVFPGLSSTVYVA